MRVRLRRLARRWASSNTVTVVELSGETSVILGTGSVFGRGFLALSSSGSGLLPNARHWSDFQTSRATRYWLKFWRGCTALRRASGNPGTNIAQRLRVRPSGEHNLVPSRATWSNLAARGSQVDDRVGNIFAECPLPSGHYCYGMYRSLSRYNWRR